MRAHIGKRKQGTGCAPARLTRQQCRRLVRIDIVEQAVSGYQHNVASLHIHAEALRSLRAGQGAKGGVRALRRAGGRAHARSPRSAGSRATHLRRVRHAVRAAELVGEVELVLLLGGEESQLASAHHHKSWG